MTDVVQHGHCSANLSVPSSEQLLNAAKNNKWKCGLKELKGQTEFLYIWFSRPSTTSDGVCWSIHQDLKEVPHNEPIYNRHCFEAPVATTSFGSTHHCDALLLFALPLSACQSILPIKPTDNSLARPLNTQAAPGRRSIMDTSPQDQPPWPYTGTSKNHNHKQTNVYFGRWALVATASLVCCRIPQWAPAKALN